MNKKSITLLPLLVSGLTLPTLAADVHWAYTGKHGTDHWGDISPKFITCKAGVNQSPINVTSAIESSLPSLGLKYRLSPQMSNLL